MKTLQHTPTPQMVTPWKVDETLKSENYVLKNTSGLTVAVCGYKEHAAFIVRAVNAHEELVVAIRKLDDYLGTHDYQGDSGLHACFIQLREALAKAEQI